MRLKAGGKRGRGGGEHSRPQLIIKPDVLPNDPPIIAKALNLKELPMETFVQSLDIASLEQLMEMIKVAPKTGQLRTIAYRYLQLLPDFQELEAWGEWSG